MREKRLLRILYISLIFAIGILLSIEFYGYGQTQYIDPNSPIRTSSFYYGYPTSYLGGLGTSFYPALGLGLGMLPPPITQQVSLAQVTPLTSSTLNASYYQDLWTMYGTQARTFVNPFAMYGSTAMVYKDPFSQAAANTMAYNNVFGVSMQAGQGYYMDPVYSTGGRYINYSTPIAGFSSDEAYSMTPYGGTSHTGFSLRTPWMFYGTEINTAAGIAGAGASIQHAAFGTPTLFHLSGLHPDVAGALALKTYGLETAAIDAMLSNQYAYTKEGMRFIPLASYYNPDSVHGSNWFFEGDISYQETGTGPVPYSGYNLVQEIPSTLVPVVGAAVAASSGGINPAFAGYVGTATAPFGGWAGGAATTGAATPSGWVNVGATSGAAATGATTTGGWAAVGVPSGAAFAGWGAPSAAMFGVVSGGGPVGGAFLGGGGPVGGAFFGGGGPVGGAFFGGGGMFSGGMGMGGMGMGGMGPGMAGAMSFGGGGGPGVSYGGAPGFM